jgi:hypothetical protein
MNDQQNIRDMKEKELDVKRKEWELITSKMRAGSGATGIDVSTIFRPEASILQELKKELQNQGDAVAEFETQDWQDEGEWIAQGWCEALEFAIKLIEGHNK